MVGRPDRFVVGTRVRQHIWRLSAVAFPRPVSVTPWHIRWRWTEALSAEVSEPSTGPTPRDPCLREECLLTKIPAYQRRESNPLSRKHQQADGARLFVGTGWKPVALWSNSLRVAARRRRWYLLGDPPSRIQILGLPARLRLPGRLTKVRFDPLHNLPHVAQAADAFRVLHLACAMARPDLLGDGLRNIALASGREIPA